MIKIFKLFPILGITLITSFLIGCSDDHDRSSDALIQEILFDNPKVIKQPVINGTDVKFDVAYNITEEELKELVPTIKISDKATVNPESGSKVDFSGDPVKFTVTAEDGTNQTVYSVSCEKMANTEAAILSMTFEEVIVIEQPVIDGTNITFYVKGNALASNLKKLKPIIEISDNATINHESGSEIDFTGDPVEFVVTAQDGITETNYMVTCIKSTSTESSILSFTLDSPVLTKPPVFDGTNILLEVKNNTTLNELKELIPTIEISDKATISPSLDSKMDLSKDVVKFIVTAGNGRAKTEYLVMILGKDKLDLDDWIIVNPAAKPELQYSIPVFGGWGTCNPGTNLMMQLGKQVDRMSVTQTTDAYSGGSAARIETLGTKGISSAYPKVVTGTLFTGKFETDILNTLNSTKFGVLYNKKPLKVKGYYKYIPGPEFHRCPNPSKYNKTVVEANTTDECAINAILYDITEDEGYITGANTYESDRIVAVASLSDGTAKSEYTPFNIDFEYKAGKTLDPNKKYRFAIICSSSKWGDTFSGAPGSVLYVDNIEIISE